MSASSSIASIGTIDAPEDFQDAIGGLAVGEFMILSKDLDQPIDTFSTSSSSSETSQVDQSLVLNKKDPIVARLLTSLNVDSFYGEPLSEEDAQSAVPPGKDGLIRHALVIPDDFCSEGKLMGGLNKRDFDISSGSIKPRRPSLPLTQSQLLTSLTKVDGPDGPRWIFHGVLNGWPSLRSFELVQIEKLRSLGPLTPSPDAFFNSFGNAWSKYWSVDDDGKNGVSPEIRDKTRIYRAKLRGAPWSSVGWSADNPGFLFWYEAQRPEPRVTYGIRAIEEVGDDRCTMVHMISHRYAVAKATTMDKLTYHSIALLEWAHGEYCTIVEGAYLNGIGGYKGRSNWYPDKDEPVTGLYKSFPPDLISPWLVMAAEIRCYDVKMKNLDEMKAYIDEYTGPDKRFLDPQYTFSHPTRLTFCSRSHIAQYLINYISRDCSYSKLTRNCQTFAADLCGFLAGKKDVLPYHPLNRIDYQNRTHLFLYDSNMYITKKKANLKGRLAK